MFLFIILRLGLIKIQTFRTRQAGRTWESVVHLIPGVHSFVVLKEMKNNWWLVDFAVTRAGYLALIEKGYRIKSVEMNPNNAKAISERYQKRYREYISKCIDERTPVDPKFNEWLADGWLSWAP